MSRKDRGVLLALVLVCVTGVLAKPPSRAREVVPVVLLSRDEPVLPDDSDSSPSGEAPKDAPKETGKDQDGKIYPYYPGGTGGLYPGAGGYPGGFPGAGFPGAGFPGAGFPGAGYPGGGFPGAYPGGFPGGIPPPIHGGYPGGFGYPGAYPGAYPYGAVPPIYGPYGPYGYWGRNKPPVPQASTAEASPNE